MGNRAEISRFTKWGAACALSLSVCALASLPVRADEASDALLDLLKAKGAITQAEYNNIKARQNADAKATEAKVQAAEARARAAEARAREAEAKAKSQSEATAAAQANATPAAQGAAPANAIGVVQGSAPSQSASSASAADEAKVRSEALTAADMPVPKMPVKSPVQYVTVLPNCVGIRIGEVDVCTKGDLDFFMVEQFPQKGPVPTSTAGGLATVDFTNSNSIRGGLLPSSIQFSLDTHQAGMDIGVYVGMYTGGVNVAPGALNANSAGSPVSLGTPGIDFRQFFGTIGTPTVGSFKVGRDIGIFASDAILNDLTLFGVGTPAGNAAPGNTTLGRIGIGYLYTDFVPQITYKSPTVNGFNFMVGAIGPYDELGLDPGVSGTMTGHDVPGGQGKLSYVNAFSPDTKLTLSTSGVVQKQVADCGTVAACGVMPVGKVTDAWAVDGFGMLDVWGWNFVAYGYTGKGVGTTGLYFNGVDTAGDARKSYGGYLQGAYTFNKVFTLGGSYGVSYLNTANAFDAANDAAACAGAPLTCLVHKNASAIGFARYQLTKWVKLQAEYTHTTDDDNFGHHYHDDAVAAGTTFFW